MEQRFIPEHWHPLLRVLEPGMYQTCLEMTSRSEADSSDGSAPHSHPDDIAALYFMEEEGLVEARKRGSVMEYRLTPKGAAARRERGLSAPKTRPQRSMAARVVSDADGFS